MMVDPVVARTRRGVGKGDPHGETPQAPSTASSARRAGASRCGWGRGTRRAQRPGHPLSRDTVPNVCPGRPLGADRRSSLPRSEAWLTGNDLWSENRKVGGSTPPLATSSRHLRRDIFATRKAHVHPVQHVPPDSRRARRSGALVAARRSGVLRVERPACCRLRSRAVSAQPRGIPLLR